MHCEGVLGSPFITIWCHCLGNTLYVTAVVDVPFKFKHIVTNSGGTLLTEIYVFSIDD